MASAKGVRAGKAYVELLTDNSPLVRGLKNARATIAAWQSSIQSMGTGLIAPLAFLGGAGVAGIALASERMANMGDGAAKAAGRLGLTVERVTELDYAASRSGSNLATLEIGLATLGKNAVAAARGNAALAYEFRRLGINAAWFVQLSPDKQLEVMADHLAGIENPAERAAMAMKLMGEGGRKLLPMLNDGAAGLRKLAKEAQALGIPFTEEDTTAAEKFIDAMTDLRYAAAAAAFKIGAALFPVLTDVVGMLAKSVGAISNWIKENRGLVIISAAVAAAALGAGVAFLGLSSVLSMLGFITTGVIAVMGVMAGLLKLLISGPGLIAVAIGGLTYAFLRFTNTGQQTLKLVSQGFQTLKDDATSAWGGIVNAIGAGDLQAAFAVGVAFVQLEWQRLTGFLTEKWANFRDVLLEFWASGVATFARLFTDALASLEIAWIQSTDFLADAWEATTNRFGRAWSTVQGGISKGIGYLIAKLNGLDPADVLAEIDADAQRRNQARQSQTDQRIGDREERRNARLQQIEENRQSNHSNLTDDARRQRLSRIAANDQEDAARSEALAKAQAKLADAVAQANAARRSGIERKSEDARNDGLTGMSAGYESKSVDAVDVRTAEGLSAIIAGIQGTNAADQTAANTAKTAAATEQLVGHQKMANQHLQQLVDDSDGSIADLTAAGAGVS